MIGNTKIIEPGTYKTTGLEYNGDNEEGTYAVQSQFEFMEHGFLQGRISMTHPTGDEGEHELKCIGNWSESGEIEFHVNYLGVWYFYHGYFQGGHFIGNYWEAKFAVKEDAPEHRRGRFSHVFYKQQ